MKKLELTPAQLRDLNIFYVILECNGWEDLEDIETRFDQGEKVSPEGQMNRVCGQTELRAQFHAPVRMVSLRVTDLFLEEQVQFHFLYESQPEQILEWIVAHAESISLDNYPQLLRQAEQLCAMILMEVSDQEIYEVKPSAEF